MRSIYGKLGRNRTRRQGEPRDSWDGCVVNVGVPFKLHEDLTTARAPVLVVCLHSKRPERGGAHVAPLGFTWHYGVRGLVRHEDGKSTFKRGTQREERTCWPMCSCGGIDSSKSVKAVTRPPVGWSTAEFMLSSYPLATRAGWTS